MQKCQEADKDLSVCIVEKGAEVGVLNLFCAAPHVMGLNEHLYLHLSAFMTSLSLD